MGAVFALFLKGRDVLLDGARLAVSQPQCDGTTCKGEATSCHQQNGSRAVWFVHDGGGDSLLDECYLWVLLLFGWWVGLGPLFGFGYESFLGFGTRFGLLFDLGCDARTWLWFGSFFDLGCDARMWARAGFGDASFLWLGGKFSDSLANSSSSCNAPGVWWLKDQTDDLFGVFGDDELCPSRWEILVLVGDGVLAFTDFSSPGGRGNVDDVKSVPSYDDFGAASFCGGHFELFVGDSVGQFADAPLNATTMVATATQFVFEKSSVHVNGAFKAIPSHRCLFGLPGGIEKGQCTIADEVGLDRTRIAIVFGLPELPGYLAKAMGSTQVFPLFGQSKARFCSLCGLGVYGSHKQTEPQ